MREALEESAVECEAVRRLGFGTHPDTHVGIAYWRCNWKAGKGQVVEGKKTDRVRWVEADRAAALFTSSLAKVVRLELDRIADAGPDGS